MPARHGVTIPAKSESAAPLEPAVDTAPGRKRPWGFGLIGLVRGESLSGQ
jgi:hypothetical protein